MLQDDRLDRVEAGRPSQAGMYVLRGLAVLAEAADSSSQLRVGGHDRPGIPCCAEVLRRIEAERGKISGHPRAVPLALGAVRLTRVFDHENAVAPSFPPHGVHIGQLPV